MLFICTMYCKIYRSQWPLGLKLSSAAACLLRLWVRIAPGGMDVCSECCVLSGSGLCDGLITRPEKTYRLWCVVECDVEISWVGRPWPNGGCCAKNKQIVTSKAQLCVYVFRMILTRKQRCLPVQHFSTGLSKKAKCVLNAVGIESLRKT